MLGTGSPQLQLGMYPVNDPQAVRQPRPDTSYYEEGNNGAGGSRMIQWGWNPDAKKAVKKHEQRMHPGKKPTFKKGGVTSAAMKAVGRNMARANNQRSR